MNSSIVILGRQPALGIAELESLYGSQNVQKAGMTAALVSLPSQQINFGRLGGAIKLCSVLTTLDNANWGKIERYLIKNTSSQISEIPDGKIQLGISAYGLEITSQRVLATGLSLKKALKKAGRAVRLVPNQDVYLSSAQVIHNHLLNPTGFELVLVRSGDQTIIARSVAEQDIASYTIRDRHRLKRDARVGMLPPKLAQIIINLATNEIKPENPNTTVESRPSRLLDPFCGTGVVLQEAQLMGFQVYGTDLEPRMIDYSAQNLAWLAEQFPHLKGSGTTEIGDATHYQWQQPVDLVACETYLGKPFTNTPPADVLAQNMTACNLIIKKFLRNIATQLKSGTRLCVAVPAWQIRPNEFKHLPLIDQISEMGYNRVSFEHASSEELLYYREDQIVARELLVLTRK